MSEFLRSTPSWKRKSWKKGQILLKSWKAELLELTPQGIKPVLIIDELQALEKIYLDNDKERQLITALFNFFVAMTKQAHLAHIIIASSDGYFLNTVYNDSKLKKCSEFMQKEKTLKVFLKQDTARLRDFIAAGINPSKVDRLLQNLVQNNIFYFDPALELYYRQGRSYQWGIKLYFESIEPPFSLSPAGQCPIK